MIILYTYCNISQLGGVLFLLPDCGIFLSVEEKKMYSIPHRVFTGALICSQILGKKESSYILENEVWIFT